MSICDRSLPRRQLVFAGALIAACSSARARSARSCEWNPGSNRSLVAFEDAIKKIAPPEHWAELLQKWSSSPKAIDDQVDIYRDRIVSRSGRFEYSGAIERMNFGPRGDLCIAVTRHKWAADRVESAIVIMAGGLKYGWAAACGNAFIVPGRYIPTPPPDTPRDAPPAVDTPEGRPPIRTLLQPPEEQPGPPEIFDDRYNPAGWIWQPDSWRMPKPQPDVPEKDRSSVPPVRPDQPNQVPEPSTLALCFGALAVVFHRRFNVLNQPRVFTSTRSHRSLTVDSLLHAELPGEVAPVPAAAP